MENGDIIAMQRAFGRKGRTGLPYMKSTAQIPCTSCQLNLCTTSYLQIKGIFDQPPICEDASSHMEDPKEGIIGPNSERSERAARQLFPRHIN